MPKASDLSINDATSKISILLKAPYKFGKTIAACSMAVDGPIWLAYWDKKAPIELLTFFKKNYPEVLSNIDYDVYGAHNANQFLNKLIDLNSNCPYFGIVVDSVTQMTSSAVNWSMSFRKGTPSKDKSNSAILATIPDWDDYKVETGLITQALDLCKNINANSIWTCHPVSRIQIDAANNNKVTKVNSIVSYGAKTGGLIPGNFTEVYHLSLDNSWNSVKGMNEVRRTVNTFSIGDDFAGTALNLPKEIDITDKLFWTAWKEALAHGNK